MVGSQAQRKVVGYLKEHFERSERSGCELIKVARSTMRDKSHARENKGLKERIFQISLKHQSYDALLKRERWLVNHKKVYRLSIEESLSLKRREEICQSIERITWKNDTDQIKDRQSILCRTVWLQARKSECYLL
ncbi:hypothetical protein [Candidatus Protochlamydia sp. W-9]|uniref:hypothetical protein n=1 Tax=Candidatus Protochlamydia sp. W-9 TaxID=1785087 RepID=UPI00096A292E|nr:hypothetical protein [Candidatus Protochlamydia sp. W-9]